MQKYQNILAVYASENFILLCWNIDITDVEVKEVWTISRNHRYRRSVNFECEYLNFVRRYSDDIMFVEI
jgi:predicted transcriptional regulator